MLGVADDRRVEAGVVGRERDHLVIDVAEAETLRDLLPDGCGDRETHTTRHCIAPVVKAFAPAVTTVLQDAAGRGGRWRRSLLRG